MEYHRHRKVLLPPVVSKEAVLRELKQFGLEPAPEEIVEGLHLPRVRSLMYAEEPLRRMSDRES